MWAAANPPAWALAWLVSTYVLSSNVDERFTNFGASAALLFALLTGLLLAFLFRRMEARTDRTLLIGRGPTLLVRQRRRGAG